MMKSFPHVIGAIHHDKTCIFQNMLFPMASKTWLMTQMWLILDTQGWESLENDEEFPHVMGAIHYDKTCFFQNMLFSYGK
jgi:hypothetical protein